MASDTTELKIAVQESDACARRLSITVPAPRVQRTRGEVTQQIARNARLPGFRKGKLPTSLIERQFGASIQQETVDRTIQQAYREALEQEGISPISQGKVEKVEYEPGEDLSFEVELEVRPEVELGRVGGFQLTRPSAEVGEEDVDSVLERLRDERGTWEPLPEDAKPDYADQVTVEITARDEAGEPKEGEEARSYRFVIGEGQAIPEVEESIRTLATGEEGDFTVHFPEDFPDEERRGEAQHLHIKLVEAARKRLPELDDAFAKEVGDFEDLAALRARILDDLRDDAKQRAESETRRQVIDQILEANPFPVPGSMVDRYLEYMTGHDPDRSHRHSAEEEAQMERMRSALRPQAEWSLKRMLVVEKLAEREGLQATQDEIDQRVEALAKQHERSPSEVWLQLEKSGQLEALEREITEDKVFEYLLSQSTVA
jgi:trigger factor